MQKPSRTTGTLGIVRYIIIIIIIIIIIMYNSKYYKLIVRDYMFRLLMQPSSGQL